MYRTGKPGTSSIVNLISDSSSEEYFSFSGAPKRKRRKKYLVPTPPGATPSDSDESPSTPSPPPSKYHATVDVEKVLLDIKDELFRSKNEVPVPQKSRSVVSAIFTCIICEEVTTETKSPVMPTCCSSTIRCKACLESSCLSQPLIKPLFDLLQEESKRHVLIYFQFFQGCKL